MTQLLVSVRNATEAEAALAGGADILDVKEPRHGSLGRAEWEPTRQAIEVAARREVPSSVALGELDDYGGGGLAVEGRLTPPGVAFAKVGLAGMSRREDWRAVWTQFADRIRRQGAQPVAAAYADWQRAAAPRWQELVPLAADNGCPVVLIDTYRKGTGGLLDLLVTEEIAEFVHAVQRQGMKAALAGSIRRSQLPAIHALGPDIVAVRGAVCIGERTGDIDETLVRQCRERLLTANC